MALGNEASTGPRIAKLGLANSLGATIMADAGGLRPLPRPLQILLKAPTAQGIIVHAERIPVEIRSQS